MVLSLRAQTLLTYGLPLLSGFFMLSWPGAMQLTFFATSIMSMIQATLFRKPWFREWAGIYPLPEKPVTPPTGADAAPKSAYSGTMTLYQPPSFTAPAVEEKKGLISGAMSEITGMRNEAVKSLKKVVGETTPAAGGRKRRTAAELRQAKAYEERRRREMAEQKRQRELTKARLREEQILGGETERSKKTVQ